MRVRGACGGGRDRLATAQVLRIECQRVTRGRGRHRCGREQAENERDGRNGRQNALGIAGLGLFGLEGRHFRHWYSIEHSSHDLKVVVNRNVADFVWLFYAVLCCAVLRTMPWVHDFSCEKNARGTYLHP